MEKIILSVNQLEVAAVLDDSTTAARIWEALPLKGLVHVWGDEVYFEIPVAIELAADARAEVAVGELGYWPMGSAFCIFFGPTPVSTDDRPRAYSPVNVFGRVLDDPRRFKEIADGDTITVVKAHSAG